MSKKNGYTKKTILKLNVPERYALLSILPESGDRTKIYLAHRIREKVVLNKKEQKDVGYTVLLNGNVGWNQKGEELFIKIEFTESDMDLISNLLDDLHKANKLPLNAVTLDMKVNVKE